MNSVELIASGYEWNCPDCDHENTPIAIAEYVICENCKAKKEVTDFHHCYE